jgi:hypothetical protein
MIAIPTAKEDLACPSRRERRYDTDLDRQHPPNARLLPVSQACSRSERHGSCCPGRTCRRCRWKAASKSPAGTIDPAFDCPHRGLADGRGLLMEKACRPDENERFALVGSRVASALRNSSNSSRLCCWGGDFRLST